MTVTDGPSNPEDFEGNYVFGVASHAKVPYDDGEIRAMKLAVRNWCPYVIVSSQQYGEGDMKNLKMSSAKNHGSANRFEYETLHEAKSAVQVRCLLCLTCHFIFVHVWVVHVGFPVGRTR